jgi:hypothetical protein
VLEHDGKFTLTRAVKTAKQIGEALEAAHALSIVHRDLKPDNIMLTSKGGGDFVKVLDFGIAKMTESEDKRYDLTQAGLIIGTPYYMSPEQVGGDKLDARSDIFSFGLIVYEMLTGELPYGGQNTQAVMISRLTSSPRPLRAIDPQIPPLVEMAVLHALERDRDLRTPSAAQLVFELEEAAAGRGPDLSKMQTKATTSPHPRPDTASFRPPAPTPGASHTPTMPVAPSGPATPAGPFTPQPQPPIYPTDRAPNFAGYGQTTAEPMPFVAMPPQPHPSYPGPPTPYPHQPIQPYPQPAQKKGGGAGLWIGLFLVLVVLGGAAIVGVVGFTQGWFSLGTTTAGPNGGDSGGPTTTGPSADELFQEGYQLQVKNDNAGAISKYRAAIAKQPQFPKAHRNLGAALVNSKQYEDAIKELDTAMEQDPSPNDQVFYNLGLAHFKLKNYEKAADYFERAAEVGNDPDAYAFAGFALDNVGDEKGADVVYKKYLKAAPSGSYAEVVKGIMSGNADVPTADTVEF